MKIYKIDLKNLYSLDMYGFKRDYNKPAHIKNVFRLDEFYRARYPQLMKRSDDLQSLNFKFKRNDKISDLSLKAMNIPEYFVVMESEYGKFEYIEILFGFPFYIPSEALGIMNTDKKEITNEEAMSLLTNDYIDNICSMFYLTNQRPSLESARERIEYGKILKK